MLVANTLIEDKIHQRQHALRHSHGDVQVSTSVINVQSQILPITDILSIQCAYV